VRPGAAPDGTGHRPLGGWEAIRPHQPDAVDRSAPLDLEVIGAERRRSEVSAYRSLHRYGREQA
jgi:hypothetical protein